MPHTLAPVIGGVLARDLRALRREIAAYPDEETLWKVVPGISNSGGNLALHLAGNLQLLIGTALGETGYVRNRDAEFTRRDVPKEAILREIDATLAAVKRGVERFSDADWEKPYPQGIGGFAVTTGDALIHLVSHLTYHLGQIDYHRRICTGQAGQIGSVAIPELVTARPIPKP